MTVEPQEADIRPIVRTPRRGLSNAMIVALAVVGAVLLFATLEARRQRASAPATGARSAEVVAGSSVPPLYVPPELPQPMPIVVAQPPLPSTTPVPQALPPAVVSRPSVSEPLPPFQPYSVSPPPVPQRPARTAGGLALVLDNTGATGSPAAAPAEGGPVGAGTQGEQRGLSTARARAAVLANRGTTVPQGTMIPAVLETAFDSTHAGFARALVQRDVRGFDGTQILIPRGSRLIGEYSEDTAQGQRRAIIMWTRLIRPDGVTVAIGSPAVDTVGRGGVKADVNTHFLERFSGAILQSSLDLGIGLAARSARSPVLIALPGSVNGVGRSGAQPADIKPTLRVPAGRSVSIFVARDLDFTGMDAIP